MDLINEHNVRIVLLGVRKMCGMMVDLIIAGVWSLLLGDILVGILYEVSSSLLRIFTGGYHATSIRMCKILTYSVTFVSVWSVFYINLSQTLGHFILMVCLGVVLFVAPVEHTNKPLSTVERQIYHNRSVLIVVIEILAYVLFFGVGAYLYAKTICVSMLLVSVGIICGKIINTEA